MEAPEDPEKAKKFRKIKSVSWLDSFHREILKKKKIAEIGGNHTLEGVESVRQAARAEPTREDQ